VIAVYLIVHGGYSLPLLLRLSLDPPVFVARQAQASQKRLPDAHELAMISDGASFPLLCWLLGTSVLKRGCINFLEQISDVASTKE
jgi:hypothetical protein